MAGLIVECRTCGRDYEPDRREIIAGYAIWSLCPQCRPPPDGPEPADTSFTITDTETTP